MPRRYLDTGGKQDRIASAKRDNTRERNIAKQYFNAGPSIGNLARAAYHYWNSVPGLGGEDESGNIIIGGEAPTPGMRNPKSIVKGVKPVIKITKKNVSKITPKQWTAAQDAAIARGDMAEAQRLRDLHFKVSAPNTQIIDKNGNLLHTYHGGQKGITTFLNPSEFDSSIKLNNYYKDGRNRIGIYTSDWESYAKQYARGYKKKNRSVYDLYVNMENPRYVSYWEYQLNRLRNLNPFRKRNFLNPSVIRPEHKEELLKGYDGVKWDIENIVFDGKQLKLSDAVTYDNNGVRIPLGERDNFNINDIRYGLLPIIGGIGLGAYSDKKKYGGTVKENVNSIYSIIKNEEFLGKPKHNYDFTQSEEWANAHGYYPDKRGHRDDRVKKPAHPSHPSKGRWKGEVFDLTDTGFKDPNYIMFGLNDGNQDPNAILTYKNSIVLPELTITSKGNYINNLYDNIKLHMKYGGIHIVPSKRGTFTAAATKHGMGVQEFAARVLRNKDDYSPSLVKKANFARNASKWNH